MLVNDWIGYLYINHFKLIILKNKNSYFFFTRGSTYSFTFSYFKDNLNNVNYNTHSRTISIRTKFPTARFDYFFKLINKYNFLITRFYFLVLKYIGKGYKFYKKKKSSTMSFYLGFSHLYYVYNISNRSFIKMKRWIYLFGSDSRTLRETGFRIRNTRFANIFTHRGVRFKKQIIYKKTGKISSY